MNEPSHSHKKVIYKEAIYLVLADIPKGQVIAYGQLGKLAGLINGARQVARVLCELPEGSNLPWHRVINSQGKISMAPGSSGYSEQERRLANEGIVIKNGKISMRTYGYGPHPSPLPSPHPSPLPRGEGVRRRRHL
jgi:methylated-DNA-protein-cysteine methyltransferase related protein